MVSFKDGILKTSQENTDYVKTIYEILFVVNMICTFVFCQVKYVTTVIALAMLAVSVFSNIRKRKSTIPIPYNGIWYFTFTSYVVVSTIFAKYVSANLAQEVMRFAVIVCLISSVSLYVETVADLERLLSLFIFSVFSIVVMEFAYVSPSEWFSGLMGSHISGFNANEIAFWAACAEMMCFYRFYIKKKRWYILLVVLFILFAFLTSSRKAAAAVIIAPIAMVILSTYKKNYSLKVFFMFLIAVLIFYIMMTNEDFYSAVGQRFRSMFDFITTKNDDEDYSLFIRSYYIDIAKDMFVKSPIIGNGFGNFYIYTSAEYGLSGAYSHNNYWQILSELGIIGFAIYYSFYIFCIIKLARDMIKKKSRISILFLALMVILMFLEYGMVSYQSKTTHLVIALAFAAVFMGEADGRKYSYIENNKNHMEED